ncbi:MAG TPA: hypothetical protein VMC09_02355 [Anaerolineales bacterium]|nr:hypothetical protein [Anaerolineales bacterium]
MKSQPNFITSTILLLTLVLLAACGPAAASATMAAPATTDTPAPTAAVSTATEAPANAEPAPLPTGTPQAAAPAHFELGAAIQLTQINMITKTDGWGLSGPYVLVTSDGGRDWQEATPPQTFTRPENAKAYADFLDQKDAWVVFSENDQIPTDAVIWSTTNRGKTWTPSAPLMHQINAESLWGEFAAHGTRSGWLLLRGVYMGAGTHYVAQLFHTDNGGLTWMDQGPNLDLGYDFTSLVFPDAQHGWLSWQTIGAYGPGAPEYAVTMDGGVNWTSLTLPPPQSAPTLFTDYDYAEPYQVNALSATSVRLLVGAFTFGDPPDKFVSYLYQTDDGGATWKITMLPTKVMASDYTMIFFDAKTGLLLGRDTYQTQDGGASWQHVSTVFWDGQYSFVDPQDGWAIATIGAQSSLVQTTNGGKSWNILVTTADVTQLSSTREIVDGYLTAIENKNWQGAYAYLCQEIKYKIPTPEDMAKTIFEEMGLGTTLPTNHEFLDSSDNTNPVQFALYGLDWAGGPYEARVKGSKVCGIGLANGDLRHLLFAGAAPLDISP